MSASISMKKKTVGMDFIKRTTGIITGATGAYISEVMPVTTSTLSEAKNAVSSVSAAFANTSQAVLPKIRQLKTQVTFRGINNWFMGKEDDYSDFGNNDSHLSFDIHTDPVDIAEAQVSELGRNANQISQAVIESSHKMVESQLAATANLMNTAEKQTAVITAGFDKTNETLNKILEVLTKNTSTLIETSVANSKRSANDDMVGSGKFNLSEYKKIISGNFKNSQFGTMATLIPAMLGDKEMVKQFLSPESVTQMLIGAIVNKKSPNLKKNMKALDNAINETVMTSLIRLGENDSYGIKGQIAKMFGIDSKRKETNTSRSTLELKTVPFDSIAHESLTNAIPGYLRKILVAVGGSDEIYDYRSRSFRTKTSIRKDFHDNAASKGNLYGASGKVRDTMGTDQFSNMVYDMMMSELGSRTSGGSARRTVNNLGNQKDAQDYILNTVLKGVNLTRAEQNSARQFSKNIGNASSGMGGIDIMNQVGRNNVNRNTRMSQYVNGANAYNVDLSDIRDSVGSDLKNIAESYGKRRKSDNSSSSVSGKGNRTCELSGQNYTNIALFEIYRKLNKGINVFQVGANQRQSDPFANYGEKYLQKPQNYRTKPMMDNTSTRESLVTRITGGSNLSGESNLLRNQQLEDGSTEELTKGQRFTRWGKNRGGNLARALFSGSPEQVKDAFTLMFRDVGQVAGDGIKRGASKLNEKSGNFTGYLKHKITGAGYNTGMKDEDGNDIQIAKNEKGGILKYFDELVFGDGGAKGLSKKISSTGSKWFKSIAGYFNYGSKDPDEHQVAGKRKTILGTSVGAMLGMGLLGGPLGIVMGGIAGSAISQTDGLGAKLKNILFGDKDHEGDKKKDRNKRRGLIGRAVDGIVDPIRFQIGKTMTTFGSVLKKNILGPLSNIGAAIKERMSSAAGGVVSKVFGGIFKGATGMLKKLIMIPLNIAKAPINAIGGLTRGAAEGGGAVVGGFLNSIAKGFAGKNGKSVINERIAGQKNDARMDRARSGYFGNYEVDENDELVLDERGRPKKMKGRSYKSWKKKQDIASDKRGTIDDYTAERRLTKEEIEAAEAAKKTAENTARQAEQGASIVNDLHGLAEEGLTKGSIFTHDDGLHQRLNTIIESITGKKFVQGTSISNNSGKAGNDSFISGAVSGASTFAVSGNDITADESKNAVGIFDESTKANPNKQIIASKLKDLMGMQRKKKGDEGEKKESIWDKLGGMMTGLLDFIKSPMGIAGLIAAVLGLTGNLGPVIDRLLEGGKNLFSWISGGGEKKNAALNAVTSPFGFKSNSELDYFTPWGEMNHVNQDAGGNDITNQNATRAKNVAWRQAGIQGGRNLMSAGLQYGMGLNAQSLGQYGQATAHGMNMRQNLSNASGAMSSSSMKAMGSLGVRTGTGMVLGKGANYLATNLAETLGVDEDTSAMIGRGTEAVTQISAMTGIGPAGKIAKKVTSSIMDDGGLLNNIAKSIIKVLDDIVKKIGADKALKAAAKPLKELIEGFASKVTGPILKKLGSVVTKIFAKETAKAAGAGASMGISIAVMAVGGGAIGATNAATLFRVKPDDVDGLMITLSAALGAIFDGLPYVGLVEILDLIIAPLNDGKGIRQLLAEVAYKAIMGDTKLESKQGAMVAQRDKYNSEWGTNLSTAEFNDATNEGFWKRTWHGKQVYDKNGDVETYADGSMKKSGGFTGLFVGNDKQFVTDSNGTVVRGEDGKGIQSVDKYGNGLKNDKKWGDHVGNFFGGAGRFFGGSTEYETDENGQAIYDHETGGFKVKSKTGNVFQRGGAAISDWWGGKEIMGPDGKMAKTTGFAEAAQKTLGGIGSAIAKPFQDTGSVIAKWWGGSEELDENGNPILDEKGNPVKKGGFKSWASDGLGKFSSTAGNLIRGVTTPVQELLMGEYERDENGNPILDENNQPIRKGGLAGWVKTGLGKLNTSFVEPAKEMVKGAADWVSTKAEWIADGVGSAKDWIVGKATSMWKSVSEPIKDIANSAKSWISDKANWLGDKAKDVGGWISDKASSAWKSISEPAKDMAAGAAEWVSKKAAWISDNAKNAKDWIVENTGKLFGSITDNVKGLVDGASTWVKEKAAWVKDGVKDVGDWIGEKATSIWDWITGGIDKIADRGEQSKRDEDYIKNHQGTGGARIGGVGGVSGPHSATESAPVQSVQQTSEEGGNPLNAAAKITSSYGYRVLDGKTEFHKGIDLVPRSGSRDAEIGAKFAGTIADVKNNLPNSHTGLGVSSNQMGNFVKLDTPSGKRVTYMHLAANSIPSSIKKGTKVLVGDKIGNMGTTGRSTGPHLHYQFNDIATGNPIDPTSSILNGSQMSSFNGVSDASLMSEGFPDEYVDSSQSVSETGESSNGLSGFIDSLKNLGMNFLSFITGGLISSTSKESGSQEIAYDQNGMSTGTSGNMGLVDGPVELLSTKAVAAIQTKREKKEVIDLTTGKSFFVSWAASSGYHSDWTPWTQDDVKTIWSLLHPNGGGNINNKNDWSWNARPGVLKLNGHMVACGFHLRPHAAIMGGNPGAPFSNQSNTKPASGWALGGHMCMYYGDSPGGTPKCNDAAKEAYVLGNKFFQAQATNLNASTVDTSGGNTVVSAGEQGIWQYLKSKGYTNAAAAGIMGCWANESNNRSDRVEGDYLGSYPGFSSVMSSQQSLDSYTTGKLFPAYAKSGNSINKEAYKGTDGHYYPGVGLAQWTGPRGYNLFQYAKSRGMDWRETNGQLEFFSKEMADRKLDSPLNSQGSASAAADFFCRKYEGYNKSSGISKRQTSANQLYDKYKGMAGESQQISPMLASTNANTTTNLVGGPVDESNLGSNNYAMNVQTPKISSKGTSIIQKLSSPFRMNSGTPVLDDYSTTGNTITDDSPIGHIEALLIQVVNELRSISTNTGTSSSLLDSLNGKDFVDKSLRDSITAVGKNQKKQVNRHVSGNNNNVRTVTSMARP